MLVWPIPGNVETFVFTVFIVCHYTLRYSVRLLGPCFKTGRNRENGGSLGSACGRGYAYRLVDFRHYLTHFSKFFSTFPHGTCLLSGSRKYLALDGNYHPLRATISRSITPTAPFKKTSTTSNGTVTLAGIKFQRIYQSLPPKDAGRPQRITKNGNPFRPGLSPFLSLILGGSLLVSLPPLSNMLKFSGYSCSTETRLLQTTFYER